MKKIYLLLLLATLSSISFAQTTREQADEIICNYIISDKDELERGGTIASMELWTTDSLPNSEGVSLIMDNVGNIFSVEYPCWAYFAYYNLNGIFDFFFDTTYYFVNKATGKVVSIRTRMAGRPYGASPEHIRIWYQMTAPQF